MDSMSNQSPISISHQQLSTAIYQELLSRILQGSLKPGERLVIDELSNTFKTSITPIREALYNLEKEGLLTRTPYQGWAVRAFNQKDILEVYEVRAALEGFAAQLCCEHADPNFFAILDECQNDTLRCLENNDIDGYESHHIRLHDIIVAGANNQTLINMMKMIRNQVRLFVRKTVNVPGRPIQAIQEHANIISAIKQRNALLAGHLMQEHILAAVREVYFADETKCSSQQTHTEH